jgi:excisionase family DNA binding protein
MRTVHHNIDPTDEYLTVAEAASLLRVHKSTIWRWIENGSLPAYRVG